MRKCFVLLALAACLQALAAAHTAWAGPAEMRPDGDITLENGALFHLAAIHIPPPARAAAVTLLQPLLQNGTLRIENAHPDRYGRTAGALYVGETDVQKRLLDQGLAFVYPPTGGEPGLYDLLQIEASARQAGRGLWADPAFADLTPQQAAKHTGHYGFVAGRVMTAARVRNMIYLNFTADWRHDFTAEIAAHDLRAFRADGADPLDLKGRTIRLRGWILDKGRPLMQVTTPAQIDIIGASSAAARQP